MNPMAQFAIPTLIAEPLFHIAGHPIYFTKQALLMILVVLASSLFLTLAVNPRRLVPTRGQNVAELGYKFVADMLHSTIGSDGLKFFPFVFTLFIFVLCSNFFGLIPGSDRTRGHGTHTAAEFWKADLVDLLKRSER